MQPRVLSRVLSLDSPLTYPVPHPARSPLCGPLCQTVLLTQQGASSLRIVDCLPTRWPESPRVVVNNLLPGHQNGPNYPGFSAGVRPPDHDHEVHVWLTATVPMDNPHCRCELTRVRSRTRSLGMPLVDCIAACTVRPAEMIGWADRIGTLGVGNTHCPIHKNICTTHTQHSTHTHTQNTHTHTHTQHTQHNTHHAHTQHTHTAHNLHWRGRRPIVYLTHANMWF